MGAHAVVKTLTSSGTSGQAPSRVLLDSASTARQTRALFQTAYRLGYGIDMVRLVVWIPLVLLALSAVFLGLRARREPSGPDGQLRDAR